MSRVPLRLRLTAAFALAMAVLLAAAGFLLYHRLEVSLDRTLAQGLRARAADVAALVAQADTGLRESQFRPEFAQVLDPRGRVFDATPGVVQPLLQGNELARARRGPLLLGSTLGSERVRLFARPVTAQDQRLVVVVGSPLETRDDALAALRTELLIGGPVGLVLASLIGYLLAAAALRPVERMRARAAAISGARPSERLPVPPSNDEVARLGETLNAMLGRLETALERERSFVADASHELRTPLAHLQAEIELALESPRGRDELEAALRSVGGEADRLSQLAEDLLLLARVDEGKLPIRPEEVDLREVLDGIVLRFERRARDAGRRIETAGGGRARVDRVRIEQALANLIENALRHGAGTILVSAVEDGGTVEVHVTDEGPGFEPDFALRAFERYTRADKSRGNGGTGLGLAIVRAIAEAHGGSAAVATAAGGGADASIRLPTFRSS